MIICDTNPYNKRGCFRLLWNSKLDKNNNLEFYKDRLIIQVESIPKLFEHVAPKYDMVILDEIEADCSKILCLDGGLETGLLILSKNSTRSSLKTSTLEKKPGSILTSLVFTKCSSACLECPPA